MRGGRIVIAGVPVMSKGSIACRSFDLLAERQEIRHYEDQLGAEKNGLQIDRTSGEQVAGNHGIRNTPQRTESCGSRARI